MDKRDVRLGPGCPAIATKIVIMPQRNQHAEIYPFRRKETVMKEKSHPHIKRCTGKKPIQQKETMQQKEAHPTERNHAAERSPSNRKKTMQQKEKSGHKMACRVAYFPCTVITEKSYL